MEDQGKRILLAVGIVTVLWLGMQMIFPPEPKPEAAATLDAGPDKAKAAGSTAPTEAGAAAPGAGAAAGGIASPTTAGSSTCVSAPSEEVTLTSPRLTAVFSPCGGALKSLRLSDEKYTQNGAGGAKEPFDLVMRPEEAAYFPLQVSLPGSTVAIDPSAKWTLEKKGDTELLATYRNDKIEVTKLFSLHADVHALDLKVGYKNLSASEIEARVQVATYAFHDVKAPAASSFAFAEPFYHAACMVGDQLERDESKSLKDAPKVRSGNVRWAGMDHNYFLFAMAPVGTQGDPLDCYTRGFSATGGMMEAALRFPAQKLAPGAGGERQLAIYAGPKFLHQLEMFSAASGGAHFDKSVELGWFGFLARPMMWLLRFFHGFLGNWGVAIIFLTITVKLLTLYWTTKSMRSMKAMAKLKPKMDELRTKYEGDKQRLNVEMMNLYKTEGVNPLGGCLPMLLQMPVWIALFTSVKVSGELYQAPFVGWLSDLTRPDPHYIVPVVMTALMFIQQKITPSTVDSAQQKMMLIVMPLMFGVFSLFFPAGVTVYILTNSLLTMVHQIWMNRTDPSKPAAAAVSVTPTEVVEKKESGGKGGKGGGKGGGRKKATSA